jgi:hypothetical protein
VSRYSRHWGCSNAAAVPGGRSRRRSWCDVTAPGLARRKTWTTGADAEATHPLTRRLQRRRPADAIWRSLAQPTRCPAPRRHRGTVHTESPQTTPPRFSEETKQTATTNQRNAARRRRQRWWRQRDSVRLAAAWRRRTARRRQRGGSSAAAAAVVAARKRDVGGSLAAARRQQQRDSATLVAAWRRRCGGAQRDGGSAVAAARWLRRWRQGDMVMISVCYLCNFAKLFV